MFFFFIFFPLLCSLSIWILPFDKFKRHGFLLIAHLYLCLCILWFLFFYEMIFYDTIFYCNLGAWLHCGSLFVEWGFQLDSLGIVMIGLVSIVSTTVHFFSLNYMWGDSNLIRFFSLLSLFTFFMFILILSDNFLVLFVGWEGIGVCSFLLISFWQTRLSASKAALKAIVLNRIGDSAFLAAISFLFLIFKSVDYGVVFSLIPFMASIKFDFLLFTFTYIEIICFFFLIGSIGKSAQLGLHGWLPEAMEGPTPVSALIHAATLVTAGVFLIIRCSPMFEYAPVVLNFILIIGGLTALFGSTVACAQNDLKRIIAFSTTSQLGYMFFACGLSGYNVALFHLLNHGFFKALLFLCAGSVIYIMLHDQDVRKYGNLIIFAPFIYSSFVVGVLALIGFPFLSGFYSKEVIIEFSFASYNVSSFYIYWISSVAATLTSFYGLRGLYLTFIMTGNWSKPIIQNVLMVGDSIIFSITILILGSIFSGLWFNDFLVGLGSSFLGSSVYIYTNNFIIDYEYLSIFIKNIPLLGVFLGGGIAFILNIYFFGILQQFTNKNTLLFNCKFYNSNFLWLALKLKSFFCHKWFLDFLLNNYFGVFVLKHSYETCYKLLDKGLLEIFITNGLSMGFISVSRFLILRQTGYIYGVFCLILICFLFFCILFFIF